MAQPWDEHMAVARVCERLDLLISSQTHHDIDTFDGVALRRCRHVCDADVSRHVDQLTLILKIEMLMVRNVGIKIQFRAVDRERPQ